VAEVWRAWVISMPEASRAVTRPVRLSPVPPMGSNMAGTSGALISAKVVPLATTKSVLPLTSRCRAGFSSYSDYKWVKSKLELFMTPLA
jgi:hypothetical protein